MCAASAVQTGTCKALLYTVVGLPHSTLLQVLFMSFMYSTCSPKIGQQKAPQPTMKKNTKQSDKPRLPCDDVCTMFHRRILCSVISLQGRGKHYVYAFLFFECSLSTPNSLDPSQSTWCCLRTVCRFGGSMDIRFENSFQ
jgi:hypothetical protein